MRVLIIDDEENIRRTTALALKSMRHEAHEAGDGATALALVAREGIHVALLDLKLRGEDGLTLLPTLLKEAPNLQIVVFTAHASIETAVEAMRRGAADYVEKPFTPDQIRVVLSRLEKTRQLQDRIAELESRLSTEGGSWEMGSESPTVCETLRTAVKAARSQANILLLGESGTGKTVLARHLHRLSDRSRHKLVTVSCPSLTKDLLASELFGHVRGAFTGAIKDSWGKVAAADNGTLLLDEIGDLPLEIQPKLLRLIQEKEYERVGETVTRRADVRLIAATNKDLAALVAQGLFREDLFYRLNVITLTLPPLRERRADLEQLVSDMVAWFARQCGKRVQGFSPAAWRWIRQHHWPGNLRELRNFVERSVILAESETLELQDPGPWPDPTNRRAGEPACPRAGDPVTLAELEKEHLRRILAASSTMEAAAHTLGIDPATLYRKRKKLIGQGETLPQPSHE